MRSPVPTRDQVRLARIALANLRQRVVSLAAVFVSPPVIVVYLAVAALACSVGGVFLLAGQAWALIAAAAQLYLFALFVAKGMSRG